MKRLLRTCFILIGMLVSLIVFTASASAANYDWRGSFAPDRVIVKFKEGTSQEVKEQTHARHRGTRIITENKKLNIEVVMVPASSVADEVQAYETESSVEYAEPDYVVRATFTPNDPYYGNQWGLSTIRAPQAWDITKSSSTVPIAILDSGVDQDHADLGAKIIRNANFTTSTTVDDKYGHGTHVAGIAAAVTNNGIGVAGVGYNASIMNVKVLSDTGSGYTSWVTNGITWAADNGAKVINMSLGGTSGTASTQAAVDYAWSKGVVLVAAAGNNGSSAPNYPAYYSNVIAVASTTSSDTKSSFSNYGSWVDVAAPGNSIYSTLPNHPYRSSTLNYGYMSGTSMASPHVAGLAALVWTTSYGTSNTSVRNRIISTANKNTPIYQQYAIPRIDAYSAVVGAAPPPDTQPPAVTYAGPTGTINSNSPTITASATDNVGVTAAHLNLNGGADMPCTVNSPGGVSVNISCPTSGLAAGSYSAQITAADAAGNTGTASGSFTVASSPPPTCSEPSLSYSRIRGYWASWGDYFGRIWSVDYKIANTGAGAAYGARIVGTVNNPSSVTSTNTPVNLGNIAAGSSVSTTVKYRIPSGVSSFSTQLYLTANDACGNTYSYPGPYPG